jgi:hypothetical protein
MILPPLVFPGETNKNIIADILNFSLRQKTEDTAENIGVPKRASLFFKGKLLQKVFIALSGGRKDKV